MHAGRRGLSNALNGVLSGSSDEEQIGKAIESLRCEGDFVRRNVRARGGVSEAMLQLPASFLTGTVGPGTLSSFPMILLGVGAVLFVGICWQIIEELIKRIRGRNWPTVSAVVDIVSVVFCNDRVLPYSANSCNAYYKATLTYVYRNPDLQIGDYSRSFGNEDDAKAWANSYKGETVKVHVDPRDPTRSVLREEDL